MEQFSVRSLGRNSEVEYRGQFQRVRVEDREEVPESQSFEVSEWNTGDSFRESEFRSSGVEDREEVPESQSFRESEWKTEKKFQRVRVSKCKTEKKFSILRN